MKLEKNINIYYHSGTGNTKYVLKCYQKEFNKHDIDISIINIADINTAIDKITGVFGIASPIYGSGTPSNVLNFVKKLPNGNGQKVFIIRTAGAGGTKDNLYASDTIVEILNKKGYKPFYNRVFAMGANWMMEHPDSIIQEMVKALPDKIEHSVNEIIKGKVRLNNKGGFKKIIIGLKSNFESMGAKDFGNRLITDENCKLCGKCKNNCPVNNIEINENKVCFDKKCIWCMKCIYSCPQQSIKATYFKNCVNKTPYNLEKSLKNEKAAKEGDPAAEKFKEKLNWYFNDVTL